MKRILLALMFGLVMTSCGTSETTEEVEEVEEVLDSTQVDGWEGIPQTLDSVKTADSAIAVL
jgi:hypothetical protein